MSDADHRANPTARGRPLVWGYLAAAILFAALLLGIHGWSVERTWIEPSQRPAPAGASGRTQWGGLIPEFQAPPRIFLDNDCYYWIRYAQTMVRDGTIRVRQTELDNVPVGRAMHWSSLFSWWLVICGGLESAITGRSWIDAIESAALWANPALFLCALAALSLACHRALGPLRTAVLVTLLAAMPGLQWAFGYGRPGHHGLHAFAALGGLLCLVLGGSGWVHTPLHATTNTSTAPDRATAMRWFTAAGIFGAFGLWIGATQQIVVFGGIGLAAVASTFLARPQADASWDGTLWRRWGATAALTSLTSYAIEYFPHFPGMRLEVNHPVYSIAFFAGGEFLARLALWRAGRAQFRDHVVLGVTLATLLTVPAALVLGPHEWHALRDPYMRRLHDHIMNFQPFITGVDAGAWFKIIREYAVLPLLLPIAGWCLWRNRAHGPAAARLLITFVPALVLGAWTLYQVRWTNLFSASLAVLLLSIWLTWNSGSSHASRRYDRYLPWIAVAPFTAMLVWSTVESSRHARAGQLDAFLAWGIASRDVAFNLKRLAQLEPVRVMSGPSQTPSLHFFGGVPGMGSLYWENVAGVRAAADFFADLGDAEARRIASERGVTHVVVQQDSGLAQQMHWVKHGSPSPDKLPRTLAWRLANPLARPPEWLEPVPYYGSPAAEAYRMRIYRVTTPAVAR